MMHEKLHDAVHQYYSENIRRSSAFEPCHQALALVMASKVEPRGVTRHDVLVVLTQEKNNPNLAGAVALIQKVSYANKKVFQEIFDDLVAGRQTLLA